VLAFQSARRALQCAAEIQRAFARRNESVEEPIRVRMGLHTGEAIKDGDDFFGKHVNLAARIAGQAEGGEILASSLLKELTASAGDIAFSEGRQVWRRGRLPQTLRSLSVAARSSTSSPNSSYQKNQSRRGLLSYAQTLI
jgi:class 3 adenylate cyclase